MKIVFCQDPLNPRIPDEAYQTEVDAAVATGLEYVLINFEALTAEGDPSKAVRRIAREGAAQLGIYRGWMTTPQEYTNLYNALLQKDIRLINNPDAYLHCHYLPESFSVIQAFTPASVWRRASEGISSDELMSLLKPFGDKPVILKDFVKSQKHYWKEACFIPSASDRPAVERVVKRFLELQADSLNEGLVFREFIEFEPLAMHSKSGMPLTKEFRIFG